MYGTVARLQLKPDSRGQLEEQMKQFEDVNVSGWISTTIYESDADPNELFLAVVFESREAYRANAESPDQHQRYLQMRELLAADPEWHDGTVIHREEAR